MNIGRLLGAGLQSARDVSRTAKEDRRYQEEMDMRKEEIANLAAYRTDMIEMQQAEMQVRNNTRMAEMVAGLAEQVHLGLLTPEEADKQIDFIAPNLEIKNVDIYKTNLRTGLALLQKGKREDFDNLLMEAMFNDVDVTNVKDPEGLKEALKQKTVQKRQDEVARRELEMRILTAPTTTTKAGIGEMGDPYSETSTKQLQLGGDTGGGITISPGKYQSVKDILGFPQGTEGGEVPTIERPKVDIPTTFNVPQGQYGGGGGRAIVPDDIIDEEKWRAKQRDYIEYLKAERGMK